ncbi:MAG: hypothetical protein ACK415_04390 [Thermodesulfovibrionales bacterium]
MFETTEYRTYKKPKKSLGIRRCGRCGSFFLTDLRGCPKWCFLCKKIIKTEYQRKYNKRLPKT